MCAEVDQFTAQNPIVADGATDSNSTKPNEVVVALSADAEMLKDLNMRYANLMTNALAASRRSDMTIISERLAELNLKYGLRNNNKNIKGGGGGGVVGEEHEEEEGVLGDLSEILGMIDALNTECVADGMAKRKAMLEQQKKQQAQAAAAAAAAQAAAQAEAAANANAASAKSSKTAAAESKTAPKFQPTHAEL